MDTCQPSHPVRGDGPGHQFHEAGVGPSDQGPIILLSYVLPHSDPLTVGLDRWTMVIAAYKLKDSQLKLGRRRMDGWIERESH